MRNIKLIIEYDGSGFNGWQAQVQGDRLRTIQEEIEKAGKMLFGKKISLAGSSRTDAGVHAKAQVANFRIDSNLPLNKIKNGLNSFLTRRISIISAEEVPVKFHSRIDSKGKLYKYTMLNRRARSPLLEKYAAFVPYDLNITAMKKATGHLIGRKDFKSFQTGSKKERDSVRVIKKIEIISKPPMVEIQIQANGFLYNMARAIAGTLIEVGRGRFKPEKVKEILEAKRRSSAGQTAPAKGLCLEKVFY
ncbi:MAG: tRNA pseudouridine(38-40) synthase TruA [Candidatus Omnitrophota bacterium]|nr:tRNA pseudouridine(38-40) synthase TruA [Candidatus Omnitrophota bacterium]